MPKSLHFSLFDRSRSVYSSITVAVLCSTCCVGSAHASDVTQRSAGTRAQTTPATEIASQQRRLAPQRTELLEAEAVEYCNYVSSVASSESKTLKYPWLFVDAGVIPVHSLELSTPADESRSSYLRFRSGVGFSPTRYYRGDLTTDRARAECERFRAAQKLRHSERNPEDTVDMRAAWAAKLSVLEASLPKANEVLDRTRASAASGQGTVLEVDAVALRVNALREQAAEARARLAESWHAPSGPTRDVARLGQERVRAEIEVERAESRLRRSAAFDVTLSGGYDRFFGSDQRLPLFAMVGVTFNTAWFATAGSEARASSARALYVAASVQRDVNDATERNQRRHALLSANQAWLRELASFRTDLERRVAQLSTIEGERSRAYADLIWFEAVRIRAEEAYLSGHIHELGEALGQVVKADAAQ